MKQACEHGKVEHGSESAVVDCVSVVGSGVVEGVTLQGGFTKLSCRFEKQHKLIDLKTGTQNLKVIAWSGCVALFTCEMRNSPLILIDNHLSIFTMILVYIYLKGGGGSKPNFRKKKTAPVVHGLKNRVS